jgi:hypothetical protein
LKPRITGRYSGSSHLNRLQAAQKQPVIHLDPLSR